MIKPTKAYRQALRASQRLHARSKKFNGRFLFRYLSALEPLAAEVEAKTLLDYGCGKGVQWERETDNGQLLADRLGVEVTKYDPAWPPFAANPEGQFDLVVCTQVLGSIPVTDLPWVIDRLYGFARKAVLVGERIKPVRKLVHAHMKDEMPHGWSHAQWAEVLRSRPIPEGLLVVLQSHDEDGSTTTENIR